jgi:hypothetical protein
MAAVLPAADLRGADPGWLVAVLLVEEVQGLRELLPGPAVSESEGLEPKYLRDLTDDLLDDPLD